MESRAQRQIISNRPTFNSPDDDHDTVVHAPKDVFGNFASLKNGLRGGERTNREGSACNRHQNAKCVQRQVLLEDLWGNEGPGSLDATILKTAHGFLERKGHIQVVHWMCERGRRNEQEAAVSEDWITAEQMLLYILLGSI